MEYLIYTTIEGDRWDLIAWAQYGNAMLYPLILQANPSVTLDPVLPGGISLKIPIIDPPAENPAWAPWNS